MINYPKMKVIQMMIMIEVKMKIIILDLLEK